MQMSDYEKKLTQGWLSWGFGILVKRPLVWSFSAMFRQCSSDAAGEYILLDALKVTEQYKTDQTPCIFSHIILTFNCYKKSNVVDNVLSCFLYM